MDAEKFPTSMYSVPKDHMSMNSKLLAGGTRLLAGVLGGNRPYLRHLRYPTKLLPRYLPCPCHSPCKCHCSLPNASAGCNSVGHQMTLTTRPAILKCQAIAHKPYICRLS